MDAEPLARRGLSVFPSIALAAGLVIVVLWARPIAAQDPVRVVVMDPLAAQLACDCVTGYAQRDYGRLAKFLGDQLGRPVEIAYAEALSSPKIAERDKIDLVIGKYSVAVFDAGKLGLKLRTMAMLTDKDGQVTQTGLFVVRQDDSAKKIEDLKTYRVLYGPRDSAEKHSAALAVLEAFDLPVPDEAATSPSCNTAAIAVVEKKADAAVISSYAMPLLEGCGTIDKAVLRIVAQTDPVPFITVFATARVDEDMEKNLLSGLLAVRDDSDLLKAMESRDGFLALPPISEKEEWTDWRGPHRHAIIDGLPEKLPAEKRLLWSRVMTGPGMAGLAVTRDYVIVADKGSKGKKSIFSLSRS